MRVLLFIILAISLLNSKNIELTQSQANYVAKKVWQNEGAGKDKYLIWWNDGEDFASLGIGHFIWFSKGHKEKFREVFPMYLAYVESKNVKIPKWLNSKTALPWGTKSKFFKAKKSNSKKYAELFKFLKSTMTYQAEFMANRLEDALPQILNNIDNKKQKILIQKNFNLVLYNKDGTINERGLYILLDYTNFKGEGTLKSERYKGQGWGLLQVLENMRDSNNSQKAFAISAKNILSRRIKNSPPKRGEERWRKGWNIRLDTYWK